MTHIAVARELGISIPAARALENQSRPNHRQLSLAAADQLARILGVPLSHLIVGDHQMQDVDPSAEQADDVARLGALVATVEGPLRRRDVAGVFGWPEPRVWEAVRALSPLLARVGQRLPAGGASLRALPRKELLNADEVLEVERGFLARQGLRVNEAKLLRRVAAGEIDARWEGRINNSQRVTLSRLLRLSLIEKQDSRYRLSEEAEISLRPAREGFRQAAS